MRSLKGLTTLAYVMYFVTGDEVWHIWLNYDNAVVGGVSSTESLQTYATDYR